MQRRRLFQSTVTANVLLVTLAAACSSSGGEGGQSAAAAAESDSGSAEVYKLSQQLDMSIEVSSTKFNETRRIPRTYSCERDNISAPIKWRDVPNETVSLALLVESDQLAREQLPDLLWAHWVLWNIPPDARELPEAVPKTASVPSIGPRAAQGTNDENNIGWSGPCKPALGSARYGCPANTCANQSTAVSKYYFRLYALDTTIDLGAEAARNDLLRAIDGHVLAAGELVGEFVGQAK